MTHVSLAEYTRMRGIPITRLRREITAGKLKTKRGGDGRKQLVAVAEADAALALTETLRPADQPDPVAAPASPDPAQPLLPPLPTQPAADGELEYLGLTRARAAREEYRARLDRLEYERRMGRLVLVQDVTRAMEHCAQAIVRELERLPLAAEDLAAAFAGGGVQAGRAALRQVVRDLRRAVADNMKLTGEADA